jgi:hypothetical protein
MGAWVAWTVSVMLEFVDALETDRCDPEIAVAELSLSDDERQAFGSHFDGMGMSELMRRTAAQPAPHDDCR